MNTFAATTTFGAPHRLFTRKAEPRLDEEAKIFLVGELVVTALATILATISWLIATNYHAPWALWQARMLGIVAAWPLYLIAKAWLSHLLGARYRARIDCELATGD